MLHVQLRGATQAPDKLLFVNMERSHYVAQRHRRVLVATHVHLSLKGPQMEVGSEKLQNYVIATTSCLSNRETSEHPGEQRQC